MTQISARTQAIRKNVALMDQHIQEFVSACENICDALDTLEDTVLLKRVFEQTIRSLQELSVHARKSQDSLVGEIEELMLLTKIDNSIQSHLRKIEELIVSIQKIFSTSKLGQAVGFALIEQEIIRLRKSRNKSSDVYYTIKAHYTDMEGAITGFLE